MTYEESVNGDASLTIAQSENPDLYQGDVITERVMGNNTPVPQGGSSMTLQERMMMYGISAAVDMFHGSVNQGSMPQTFAGQNGRTYVTPTQSYRAPTGAGAAPVNISPFGLAVLAGLALLVAQ